MNKYMLLGAVGLSCRLWRKSMDYKMEDVAKDVGVGYNSVAAFERGECDSVRIFMWYILRGFDVHSDFCIAEKPGEKIGVDKLLNYLGVI